MEVQHALFNEPGLHPVAPLDGLVQQQKSTPTATLSCKARPLAARAFALCLSPCGGYVAALRDDGVAIRLAWHANEASFVPAVYHLHQGHRLLRPEGESENETRRRRITEMGVVDFERVTNLPRRTRGSIPMSSRQARSLRDLLVHERYGASDERGLGCNFLTSPGFSPGLPQASPTGLRSPLASLPPMELAKDTAKKGKKEYHLLATLLNSPLFLRGSSVKSAKTKNDRRVWTKEEDHAIRELVAMHGTRSWCVLATPRHSRVQRLTCLVARIIYAGASLLSESSRTFTSLAGQGNSAAKGGAKAATQPG
eukprot:scaffold1166_cov261-Pinguiococcus_pyrenoidosus.AAC.64